MAQQLDSLHRLAELLYAIVVQLYDKYSSLFHPSYILSHLGDTQVSYCYDQIRHWLNRLIFSEENEIYLLVMKALKKEHRPTLVSLA